MLVLVVGPSGAGKDTLINAARTALAEEPLFVFPRRVVTREAVAALEDHDSVSPAEFARAAAAGEYALSWEAHGLSYGLPASLVENLRTGRVVVLNASRGVVGMATQKFPDTRLILVDAAAEVRAKRLASRGRESDAEVTERLRREVPAALDGAARVDNSGDLQSSVAAFTAALRTIAEG
jgi:ribose 1,5-bisphosphokinase